MSRASEIDARHALERRLGQESLLHYIFAMAPFFVFEAWHCLVAEHLEQLFRGKITRLMCFVAPRAGKSEVISIRFPAWALGKLPTLDLMQVSYSQDLSSGFGRQVRDQINSEEYQRFFPGVHIREDLSGAKNWAISHPEERDKATRAKAGVYWSAGIGSGIAGKGWGLGLIDDPLSEQDKDSETAMAAVNSWYGPGFYTRRQAMTRTMLCLLMTRWNTNDLAGYLLKQQDEGGAFADQWLQLQISAILDTATAERLRPYAKVAQHYNQMRNDMVAAKLGTPREEAELFAYEAGGSYAPKRWPLDELMRTKSTMAARDWNSLYQQQPSDEEGNIILREYWVPWTHSRRPQCELVFACYDTSYEETNRNDPSARTTWGVFRDPSGLAHLILLEAWSNRVAFPALKRELLQHWKAYKPDQILVEKRSSGVSLIQDLKRSPAPVMAWLPPGASQGNKGVGNKGKIPRAHACTGIFANKRIHYIPGNAAISDVIEQCANFPFAKHDDYVDTVTMAVLKMRYAQGIPSIGDADDPEEEDEDSWGNDDSQIIKTRSTRRGLRLAAVNGRRR